MKVKKQSNKSTAHAVLANAFAPQALDFRGHHQTVGDQWAQVYGVHNFPPRVKAAWLARAANQPGVTMVMHMMPSDPTALVLSLSRRISLTAGSLQNGGNALLQQRAESELKSSQELMKKIDQQQQPVFKTGVFFLVTAPDDADGTRRAKRLKAKLGAAGMRPRNLSFRQEEGLLACGPWGIFPEVIRGGTPFQFPCETVAAAFPFSAGGINHRKGITLGSDSDGGIVLVDRWDLQPGSPTVEAGVTNRNWTILAASGAGKTWTTMLTILREYAQGAVVIIIDPEREYRALCRRLGGTWINTVGGRMVVNPFQAAPAPVEADEDTDEDEGYTAMAQHIQRVRTFFNLYLPQLTDIQRAFLRRGIMAVYRKKEIDIDTDPATVASDGWPTIKDLHAYCVTEGEKDQVGAETWATLAALLEDAADGIDSRIWSGGSQPATDKIDFLVLDIHDLQEAEESVQKAQYFNVLGYAWDILRRDRSERVMLVVDEAWMLIDPKTPQALSFLKKMAKRIRKYSGSLNVVTQNAIDFTAPEVAREGEPVLANSSTKFLLRQESKDLPAVTALFNLSEEEQNKLSSARQGEGLLISGNSRAWVTVDTFPHERVLIKGQ
ncbi:MAG: DUF87 domain-containing protein [Peptococcaceae bacterium]|jgi:hypothetical protein|nr:DUF87 domain-containing protein [Peptococcaceae bacterium]